MQFYIQISLQILKIHMYLIVILPFKSNPKGLDIWMYFVLEVDMVELIFNIWDILGF